jgi:hypothetical protein
MKHKDGSPLRQKRDRMGPFVVLLCRVYDKTRNGRQVRDDRTFRVAPHGPQKLEMCHTYLGHDRLAFMLLDEVVYYA